MGVGASLEAQVANGGSNVLRVGLVDEVGSLDPQTPSDYGAALVQAQLFESPYRRVGQQAEPHLFERPLMAIDARGTYEGIVRADVYFSDGTQLTAAHVAEALQRSRRLGDGARLEAREQILTIRLPAPDPSLPTTLASDYCAVAREVNGRWLGTGPFMLAEFEVPSGRTVLVPNPHHHGLRPRVGGVELTAHGTVEALLEACERDAVDFTNALPRDAIERIGSMRKKFEPGANTAILWLQTERLTNIDVRRAIVTGLERYSLAGVAFSNAGAFRARGLLPPSMSNTRDGIRFDPERARKLLEQARVPLPLELRGYAVWGARGYLPKPHATAAAISEQLRPLDIEIEWTFASDSHDYLAGMRRGDFDLGLGGWTADSADPYDFLEAVLHSHSIPEVGAPIMMGCNFARWRDAETDRLLEEYRRRPSAELEEKLYALIDDRAMLRALNYGATGMVTSRRVPRLEVDSRGIPRLAAAELDAG